MIPVVDEVAQEYHNTFSVVRLDIDANRQIPAKYGVRGIPAYRVFRNGKVVGVFVGAMPKANFVKSVLDSLR
jgi:thioredoxin 1